MWGKEPRTSGALRRSVAKLSGARTVPLQLFGGDSKASCNRPTSSSNGQFIIAYSA